MPATQGKVTLLLSATDQGATNLIAAGTVSVPVSASVAASGLNSTTSPAVTAVAQKRVTLSAGAATLDLTALDPTVGTNGSLSLSGKRVVALHLSAPADNGAGVSLATGAANGYVFAGTGWKLTLLPGQAALVYAGAGAPLVDGTHKAIDLAGAGTDKLDLTLLAG